MVVFSMVVVPLVFLGEIEDKGKFSIFPSLDFDLNGVLLEAQLSVRRDCHEVVCFQARSLQAAISMAPSENGKDPNETSIPDRFES